MTVTITLISVSPAFGMTKNVFSNYLLDQSMTYEKNYENVNDEESNSSTPCKYKQTIAALTKVTSQ